MKRLAGFILKITTSALLILWLIKTNRLGFICVSIHSLQLLKELLKLLWLDLFGALSYPAWRWGGTILLEAKRRSQSIRGYWQMPLLIEALSKAGA